MRANELVPMTSVRLLATLANTCGPYRAEEPLPPGNAFGIAVVAIAVFARPGSIVGVEDHAGNLGRIQHAQRFGYELPRGLVRGDDDEEGIDETLDETAVGQ